MLVLCSRSARPQKGLARRPQSNQTWVSFREEKLASLDGPFIWPSLDAHR